MYRHGAFVRSQKKNQILQPHDSIIWYTHNFVRLEQTVVLALVQNQMKRKRWSKLFLPNSDVLGCALRLTK